MPVSALCVCVCVCDQCNVQCAWCLRCARSVGFAWCVLLVCAVSIIYMVWVGGRWPVSFACCGWWAVSAVCIVCVVCVVNAGVREAMVLTRQIVPSHTPCLVGCEKGAMKAVWVSCNRAVSSVMSFMWAPVAGLWVTVKYRSHCLPLQHHCSWGIHSTAGAGRGFTCSSSHDSSSSEGALQY